MIPLFFRTLLFLVTSCGGRLHVIRLTDFKSEEERRQLCRITTFVLLLCVLLEGIHQQGMQKYLHCVPEPSKPVKLKRYVKKVC